MFLGCHHWGRASCCCHLVGEARDAAKHPRAQSGLRSRLHPARMPGGGRGILLCSWLKQFWSLASESSEMQLNCLYEAHTKVMCMLMAVSSDSPHSGQGTPGHRRVWLYRQHSSSWTADVMAPCPGPPLVWACPHDVCFAHQRS